MKREDLIILLFGLLLLAGMIITVFVGRGKSLHGVGFLIDGKTIQQNALGLGAINQKVIPHWQDGQIILPMPGIAGEFFVRKSYLQPLFLLEIEQLKNNYED